MDGVPAESCTIGEEDALRGLFGQPGRLAAQKTLHALDRHCRDFIARSPFLCLGTADAAGRADVSPRGDRPGFVLVLDDRTLAIGIYLAGVVVAGVHTNEIFIENGRFHGAMIADSIARELS